MTTIIIDPKTQSIYSDKRSTTISRQLGWKEYDDLANKVKLMDRQTYAVTGAGDFSPIEKFPDSFNVNRKRLKGISEECRVYRVKKQGKGLFVEKFTPKPFKETIIEKILGIPAAIGWSGESKFLCEDDEPMFIGSGGDFALAAYHSGVPIGRIIPDVVSKLDNYTSHVQDVASVDSEGYWKREIKV